MSATDPVLAQSIVDHWSPRGDLRFIRRDLERRGQRTDGLTVEQLARYDQLHAGQLTATRDFAAWVRPAPGDRVLDLGAGLGGAARVLASEHGCRVHAVELSDALHRTGETLTQWLGLTDAVSHHQGDLLTAEVASDVDLVWLQHVDMHVADKAALYARAKAALQPRGRVVWHDWLAGPTGSPHHPVPWTDDGGLSFLRTRAEFSLDTGDAGLVVGRLEDVTERTHAWFSATRSQLQAALARLPDDADARRARFADLSGRMENVLRNLDEQRLLPIYAEASRS